METIFKVRYEREIKSILAKSGLYKYQLMEVDKIVERVAHLISPALSGEAILTIGAAISEILNEVAGVISVGPFGCMPSRVAEAIISKTINNEKKREAAEDQLIKILLEIHPYLPFLSLESDGNVFPQIIEAKLEAFCLQVKRINKNLLDLKRRLG